MISAWLLAALIAIPFLPKLQALASDESDAFKDHGGGVDARRRRDRRRFKGGNETTAVVLYSVARRDTKLHLDQIEPGDRLGNRMLDLQPRVHFHEPEAVAPKALRAIGDEFDRAGALIADRARGFGRGASHLLAHSAVMPGAGASSITF